MTNDDYLLYRKGPLSLNSSWVGGWDTFVSAFNSSDRVQLMANHVAVKERYWLNLPEYGFKNSDLPNTATPYTSNADSEFEFLQEFFLKIGDIKKRRILIDITGFLNHYVVALAKLLIEQDVDECTIIYGEPVRYLKSEQTQFSDRSVMSVRQIVGFEGVHSTDTKADLLILASGYDARLVAEVANNKEHATKIQLFGLPSMRPDMYQESLLASATVADTIGPEAAHRGSFKYAPANDPFITASELSKISVQHRIKHPLANLYISPLSTKPQALGCALFYLSECPKTATSILYPYCRSYARETSEGLARAWRYDMEFAHLRARL